jgi:hypothetical protein
MPQPMSLEFLLENAATFDKRDRRVLAVIIAHSFLQLCESPWLRQKWGKESIFFFPRVSESVVDIHKPYIAPNFQATMSFDDTRNGPCPHPYPSILALGILLLELELGRTIVSERAAEDEQHNHSYLETDRRTATRITRGKRFRKNVCVGYLAAINACLECKFVPNGAVISAVNFREAIYENIVIPIEKELYDGWNILMDDPQVMVDDLPCTVDILATIVMQSAGEYSVSNSYSSATVSTVSGTIHHIGSKLSQARPSARPVATFTLQRTSCIPVPEIILFDDEESEDIQKGQVFPLRNL